MPDCMSIVSQLFWDCQSPLPFANRYSFPVLGVRCKSRTGHFPVLYVNWLFVNYIYRVGSIRKSNDRIKDAL